MHFNEGKKIKPRPHVSKDCAQLTDYKISKGKHIREHLKLPLQYPVDLVYVGHSKRD